MSKFLCAYLAIMVTSLFTPTTVFFVLTSLNTSFALAGNLAPQQPNNVRAGQVIKKVNLLKLPHYYSDITGSVAAKEHINIQTRKSAWYFISTASLPPAGQLSGWVNMLNVRFISAVKRQGELGVKSLFSSVNNDSLPTVSTGVRGFDVDDLQKAKADLKQVALLNSYTVSAGAAARFAKQGKLKASHIKVKED
ncbi:hypothetical protein [Colwellia piezophila]|uniref:hypothetical protein n=1 Tax=Colwellia piezophila TaxID=211668 RepID=UPI0003699516|nr:hypothetical protein [Colwellia piezophila]